MVLFKPLDFLLSARENGSRAHYDASEHTGQTVCSLNLAGHFRVTNFGCLAFLFAHIGQTYFSPCFAAICHRIICETTSSNKKRPKWSFFLILSEGSFRLANLSSFHSKRITFLVPKCKNFFSLTGLFAII